MTDLEALQGLWRIKSHTTGGSPVASAATHYVIAGQCMKQIVPNTVDDVDGKLRSTLVLDESTEPRRLTNTLDYNGPDGPPDPRPIVLHYLYRLTGDTLVLCDGPYGAFPDDISDDFSILTLERDYGPVPALRKPSGTPPLTDDDLGTLPWDDDLNWYCGKVELDDLKTELCLNPDKDGKIDNTLKRAKAIVSRIDHFRQLAEEFAVDQLLELKNDVWLEDGEPIVTAGEFKSRIALESISFIADGQVEFWFHDGQLFFGHSITVVLGADDKFISASF